MPLDVTLLKPAQIGTSEIATKFDVSTSLAAYNPAEVINTNTTTIDGGKITTGSITSGQIAANTITTNNIALGTGLVNGYMQSSDFTTIGEAGFRLKSNAAGTSADPTIYGAYIKGGVISGITITGSLVEASTLQVVSSLYPSNYGRIIGKFIATGTSNSITSTTLYYGSYGSGYLPTRVCNTYSIIIITGTYSGAIQGYPPLIQRSINGGGWVTIYTMPTDTTGGGTIAYQDTSINIANSSVAYKISGSYVTTLTPMICVEIYN